MELGRRGFMSVLGMAALAKALPVPDFMVYEPEKLELALDCPVTLTQMVRELAREFERALGGYKTIYLPAAAGLRVGEQGMTDQFNVTCMLPIGEEMQWRERIAKPAGETLALAVKTAGLREIGDLAMPGAGAYGARFSSKEYGISLRGALLYEPGLDERILRFDLIGRAA